MPVLQPNEYDKSYFDGGKMLYQRNGGYSSYKKWFRINDDWVPHDQSTGEYWKDLALKLTNDYDLNGKKVLEIGCAKGFVVEGLRDLGIDAYGIDVSGYAIGCARADIQQYLTVGDITTDLTQYRRNEFDLLFSRWVLECIADADLPKTITEMNRIARLQLHSIDPSIAPEWYNRKPITSWLAMDFKKGTLLTDHSHFKNLKEK